LFFKTSLSSEGNFIGSTLAGKLKFSVIIAFSIEACAKEMIILG
jgi:hypothetical protein